MKNEYPIVEFKNQAQWRAWLVKNHAQVEGVWIRFYKKDSGIKTIVYAEALDNALCFGWIDGQAKKYDEKSYVQKFTPRRSRSIWSKRNIENIDRLTKHGLMMPAGIAEVERAKMDGRWELAYDSSKNMVVPDDFLQAVRKNKKAHEFFKTLNKSNIYAIGWRLQTAKKPETRARRFAALLAMLEKEEKLH
jgi:uncharacterized protein YdeI (YjbR/CyaY-like superfamily)